MNRHGPGTLNRVFLKDYQPPSWLIDAIELEFDLGADATDVRARLKFRCNPNAPRPAVMELNGGDHLDTVAISLNDIMLRSGEYEIADGLLRIPDLPDSGMLETHVRISPCRNTALEGLYLSEDVLVTQCESQGFRHITWFLDRPDVLSVYRVTLRADKREFPTLLSNGNLVESRELGDGRHQAVWHDPAPKPSYLFAIVAGKLGHIETTHVTPSGRRVSLRVFGRESELPRCDFALSCLKRAVEWDERVFGLECDLDDYKLVAVNDFNAGAMENKGLNIFNAASLLVDPESATDATFVTTDITIAHEYFHNWTGNRVTLRDWFQLSLKEGLTSLREQMYHGDMYSPAIELIERVQALRAAQFAEDSGPGAHPVRPESVVAVDNLYTSTIYLKGAEVVRMFLTLTSREKTITAMRNYLRKHDGSAATMEDFAAEIEAVAQTDFSQYRRWLTQAGTPVVSIEDRYDPARKEFHLKVRQSCPPTPDQEVKLPFLIPMALGLLDEEGNDIPLQLVGESLHGGTTRVLLLTEAEHTFTFVNVPTAPVPSYFRQFSAPVKVERKDSFEDLLHRMAHDSDPFGRWEAGQTLSLALLRRVRDQLSQGQKPVLDARYVQALRRILRDDTADPAFRALMLAIPSLTYVETLEEPPIDIANLLAARRFLWREIALRLHQDLLDVHRSLRTDGPCQLDGPSIARRRLKNTCLELLALTEDDGLAALYMDQFRTSSCMTDTLGALSALCETITPEREVALEAFLARWENDPLVMRYWFSVQAGAVRPDTLTLVKELVNHPTFHFTTPNHVRSVFRTLAANAPHFHRDDGAGYEYLSEIIQKLDPINPMVASVMATRLEKWKRYAEPNRSHMKRALEAILRIPNLSKNTWEIVNNALTR